MSHFFSFLYQEYTNIFYSVLAVHLNVDATTFGVTRIMFMKSDLDLPSIDDSVDVTSRSLMLLC